MYMSPAQPCGVAWGCSVHRITALAARYLMWASAGVGWRNAAL